MPVLARERASKAQQHLVGDRLDRRSHDPYGTASAMLLGLRDRRAEQVGETRFVMVKPVQ